jgi:phage shock protein C
MSKRLYRSRRDRMLAGICGGLGEYFDLDPTLIRVATVLLFLVTGGMLIIAYVILALVIPNAPLSAESSDAAARPALSTTATTTRELDAAAMTVNTLETQALAEVRPQVPDGPVSAISPELNQMLDEVHRVEGQTVPNIGKVD